AAVPAAAVLVVLVMARWALDLNIEHLVLPSGQVAGAVPEPPKADVGWHLVLGGSFAVMFGAAGYGAQGRHERAIVPMLWGASAVLVAVALVGALYYRINPVQPSVPFAAAALVRAPLYCAGHRKDGPAPAPSRDGGGGCNVRARCGGGARARPDHDAREGLAHHRPVADGAGRRLGGGKAAIAGAALARRYRRGAGARAHRL